jgi:hypothetical protein
MHPMQNPGGTRGKSGRFLAGWRQHLFGFMGDVMDTSLLRKIDLESGLESEIYDVSRKLAGDRWYVGFIARVEIPITFLAGYPDSPEVNIEKMKDVLGEAVRFEQKRDRHYVDEKEKDAMLNGLIDDFLASTLPYFSEEDFAKKYALIEYKKKLKKASCYMT